MVSAPGDTRAVDELQAVRRQREVAGETLLMGWVCVLLLGVSGCPSSARFLHRHRSCWRTDTNVC